MVLVREITNTCYIFIYGDIRYGRNRLQIESNVKTEAFDRFFEYVKYDYITIKEAECYYYTSKGKLVKADLISAYNRRMNNI